MAGESSEALTPLVDATAELRGLGHDSATIGRLYLNGAAVVLGDGLTEAEFLEIARQMWRAKERQLALLSLLDRIQAAPEYRVRFRRESKPTVSRVASGVRGETT